MEKAATNRMPFINDEKDGIPSSTNPTIIGPKAIFTHPSLLEFLTAISMFGAYIFIWSSMKRSTIRQIVDYLFCSLPPSFEILRQDNYRKIETSRGKYLKVISKSKGIFLKNLSKVLFISCTHLDRENNLFIDDSPKKCVYNDSGNCQFIYTWTPLAITDDFLLCTLIP